MANITAQMVKELRERTGAGMMDCKAALQETSGDMEQAVDLLRKKGLAKAAKKAGRIAAEGLIGLAVEGSKGVLVEVNSETDFVARNDLFQGLVKMIANVAPHGRNRRREDQGGQGRHAHHRGRHRRHHRQDRREHVAAAGVVVVGRQGRHRQLCAQLRRRRSRQDRRPGRAGVRPARADELKRFGRMVAMHVAASNPQAVDSSGLDAGCGPAREGGARRQVQGAGKACECHRQDRRIRAQDLLQGGLPARSGLHPRAGQERCPGHQGSRGQGRRSDQG